MKIPEGTPDDLKLLAEQGKVVVVGSPQEGQMVIRVKRGGKRLIEDREKALEEK